MQYFQSPFEQEDAVQEAFTHLYAHLDSVDPMRAESLPGWVVTSARNRILDLARQKRPNAQLELTDDLVGEEASKGLEVVVSAELKAVMANFEEKLKPAYRPYFHAVFIEGRDWEEARVMLGLARLRTKYLKSVLLKLLQRHGPLLDVLGRERNE